MIIVNEIFGPTIQGEGKNAGKRVAFLRLGVCNLHCYLCDSDYTWRFNNTHPHASNIVYQKKDELHPMRSEEVLEKLLEINTGSLVISGGEPLLQQHRLTRLLDDLKRLDWFIEVETNGTIEPLPEFLDLVDQVNCSPKLEGEFSGEPKHVRINRKALQVLSENPKVNFKFVVAEDTNIEEMLDLVKEFSMREVRLMPECRTREELFAKKEFVESLCKKHGFIYATRLSIEISGTKRGV